MNPEIAVTGASGFIGGRLIARASYAGLRASGYSRKGGGGLVTVRNYAELPRDPDTVLVHLAQGRRVSGPFDGTEIDVCRALAAGPWRHIVYASTAVVYGDALDHPRRSDEPVSAGGPYAAIKLQCEDIVRRAGGTILRLGNVYGQGMDGESVVAHILGQLGSTSVPVSLGNLRPVRDFVWIEDVVDCFLAAVKIRRGGTFNVGSGRGVSIEELAQTVVRLAGQAPRAVVGREPARHSHLVLDIAHTSAVLGWEPRTTLDTGLSILLRERGA